MDGDILTKIDPIALGRELYEARRKRGLTQEDAALVIGVARTTVTAIEKGERRIKPGELIKLARAYGREVSDFVRRRPMIAPFATHVQFRGPQLRTSEDEAKIAPCIDQFEELCRNYLELEEITEAPIDRKYPAEYVIAGLTTEAAAENVALEERNRLGLGDGPIPALRNLLEQDVGLRIFYLKMPHQFAEIYYYDDQLGGCLAINSQHPEERRRWSLAHGYSHFLAHRHKPEILVEDGYQRQPENERFADLFARYFLLPTSGLVRRYNGIKRTQGEVKVADLLTLANYYGISFDAFMRRLEMGLVPTGTADRLRDRGLKVREAQQLLGIKPLAEQADTLPKRYLFLAFVAFERAWITERQFAHFLHRDIVESRQVAEILRRESDGLIADIDADQDLAPSRRA